MNKRFYSNQQESRVAKDLKGIKMPNSGATLFQKGDVLLKPLKILIECKTKEKESNSISIKKEWFDKNKEDAFGMGLNPNRSVICFNFGDNENNYYILTSQFFTELINILKEKEGDF